MAMVKCRECGRDISDQAASCPGCGAPLYRAPVSVAAGNSTGRQLALAVVLLGFLAILFLGLMAFLGRSSNGSPGVGSVSTQQHEREVVEYCREDYAKKKDDPRLDRNALSIVYAACEKLENDYRAKWGRDP